MRIFITGGNGQLAYELARLLDGKTNDHFIAPTKLQFDITNESHIQILKDFKPDVIINTAAYTKVDLAEGQKDAAFAANAAGVKNIAILAQQLQCKLVHLSTDYVFDGKRGQPYQERDRANPINIYGASKLKGEEIICGQHDQYMILRVSAVFGQHGYNFVKSILNLAKSNDSLRVVHDQITCPTPATKIAETLLQMIKNPNPGIYHYCGDEPISWYEFAKHITKGLGRNIQIVPIKTEELTLPAKRPLYSVLDCVKLNNTFGIHKPSWEAELTHVINALSIT